MAVYSVAIFGKDLEVTLSYKLFSTAPSDTFLYGKKISRSGDCSPIPDPTIPAKMNIPINTKKKPK